MAKNLFSNIGKKARDLLYKDYENDIKVAVFSSSTYEDGTELTASVARNASTGNGEIHGQMKGNGIIYDLKANNSDINQTVTIGNSYIPDFKAVLHWSAADLKADKFEVQYSPENGGVFFFASIFGLGVNLYPVVNFSPVIGFKNLLIGTNNLEFGLHTSLDTATWDFNWKLGTNLGVTWTKFNLITSLAIWNNKEIISSSFYLKRNVPYWCTIGGEMSYNMYTKKVVRTTFGLKFVPTPESVLKARNPRMVWMPGSNWKVSALIKHKLVQLSTWNKSSSYFTISAEFDPKTEGNKLKIGFALLIEA